MTKDKALFFVCFIALLEAAPCQTKNPVLTTQLIVARMAQARASNHARFRPYTVRRDYRLFGKNEQSAKSQVIADVSFSPPDQRNFAIRESRGTGMGENVVRRMLKSEIEIAGDDSTEISADNYQFRLIGQQRFNGRLCYVLELHPRRQDKHLMIGKAWVDSQTYLLHRAEGEPAKKPSWWVRDLHFALEYGNVGGMWLPTGIEATANVRVIGECKLVSRNVGISVGQFAANLPAEFPARKGRERRD